MRLVADWCCDSGNPTTARMVAAGPSNKAMKLTRRERIEVSQLIAGVRLTVARAMRTAAVALSVLLSIGAASGHRTGEEFTELLGCRLLKTNLAEVQRRFGPAQMLETGDAGEYEASVCYVDAKSAAVVSFKSGEMGGAEHTLLGFELRHQPGRGEVNCGVFALEAVRNGPRVGPLHLGMSRESFARALGPLQAVEGRGVGRVYERTVPMTQAELGRCPGCASYPFWDVVVSVVGEFERGRLVVLRVWKTETS